MNSQEIVQPLDRLMTTLGLSNADLVGASTEQLTFKMVQKGRKGRPLTLNAQEKILSSLLKLKPDLKIRRRELFAYPMDEAAIEAIEKAQTQSAEGKISYPEFVDQLLLAGVMHYAVRVAEHEVTYYGAAGHAHTVKQEKEIKNAPGHFFVDGIRQAILAAQKRQIDYPTFLERIHQFGVLTYEVNLRQRKIFYKGSQEFYREQIPTVEELKSIQVEPEKKPAKPRAKAVVKKPKAIAKKKIIRRKKRPGIVRVTRKARVDQRKRLHRKRRPRSKGAQ